MDQFLDALRSQVLPHRPEVVIFAATVSDLPPATMSASVPKEQFRTTIGSMRRVCEEAGIDFRVFAFTEAANDPESRQAVRVMEQLSKEAGANVVSVERYLDHHAGENFATSRWDSHPNAACHRLHAEILTNELERILEHAKHARH
jgi:hypothetical protein